MEKIKKLEDMHYDLPKRDAHKLFEKVDEIAEKVNEIIAYLKYIDVHDAMSSFKENYNKDSHA